MSPKSLETNFGEWLRSKRTEKKLDTRGLASTAGIDSGTISRLENGRSKVLLHTVIRLCEGLEVSPSEFIKDLRGKIEPFLQQNPRIATDGKKFLSLQDVENFLYLFRQCPEVGNLLLIDLLNNIFNLLKKEEEQEPLEATTKFFVIEDVEKLLTTSPLYKFELQLPPIENNRFLEIYTQGGVLIPADAGMYVSNLRSQRDLTLDKVAKSIARSMPILSRLEAGSIERIKLLDVLLLDDFLQEEGRIFALFWSASEFYLRIAYSTKWTKRESKIGYLLVIIARWQQFLNEKDYSWLHNLRDKIRETKTEF